MQGPSQSEVDGHLDAIARHARLHRTRIAIAESVTAGRIATELARGENASEWFRGGIVAYGNEVKYHLLGVPRGPVITATCAATMATAVRELLDADVGVGVTGVGGPEPVEDQPAGTVFIGLAHGDEVRTFGYAFEGDADEIVESAVRRALVHLEGAVR
jgi:nicotinamide-nucleotide amidase